MICDRCEETSAQVKHHYNGDRKFFFGFGRGSKVPDWMVTNICHECHIELHKTKEDRLADSEEQLFLVMKSLYREKG